MDAIETLLESASEHDFYAKRAREWLEGSSMPEDLRGVWGEKLSHVMEP
jgi:hypothetical protein